MKMRAIIVPMNEKACEEIEYGLDYTNISEEDYTLRIVSQNEFDEIVNTGIFESINAKCNTMIDDFESERIENDKLDIVTELLDAAELNRSEVIQKNVSIFRVAKKSKTFVELDF